MPLTRSLGASSSCLRCQLRQVIFNTRLRRRPRCYNQCEIETSRGLTTSLRRCQDDEDEEDAVFLKRDQSEDERRARYRREYPLGRIVGQAGRRQRERSETLRIDSMNRPFDVVLMQDIHETKEKAPSSEYGASQQHSPGSIVTAAEVASGLLNKDKAPSQDEVDASIDALRPNISSVDEMEFYSLLRQLAGGYNAQQLSLYLANSRRLRDTRAIDGRRPVEDLGQSKLNLPISSWRPGRTPIEKRHGDSNALRQAKRSERKKRITEQILRSAWSLSIRSEEDEVGELEISLESWQFQYLFDMRWNDQRNYNHLIQPQILLRRSEVLSFRRDHVMRIVARQRDAEEIADLILQELRQVGRIELDLNAFKSLLGKSQGPKSLTELFPESCLEYIAKHTTSVIEIRDGKTLCIYNKSDIAREHAKRLVLSLLQLPSPISIAVHHTKDGHKTERHTTDDQELFLLPEVTGSSLHLRHRGLPLYRLAVPKSRLVDVPSTATHKANSGDLDNRNRRALATDLANELHKLKPPATAQACEASARLRSLNHTPEVETKRGDELYWYDAPEPGLLSWEVQICKVLNSSVGRTSKKTLSPRRRTGGSSILQANTPGIDTLLSYFEPINETGYAFDSLPKAPYLVAHLFPSPFAARGIQAMHHLPRVELWYQLTSLSNDETSPHRTSIHLSYAQAILHQQELRVSLPVESVDLRILRRSPMTADINKIIRDEEIAKFSETLRQSASDGSAVLAGRPALKLKLPAWVAEGKVTNPLTETLFEVAEVDYLFGGFEQVQIASYAPLQPDCTLAHNDLTMSATLRCISNSMFLEYKTIEGGIVGGNRGELTLKYNDATISTLLQEEDNRRREKHVELVHAALSLASTVTKINARDLGSSQGSMQSH